MPNFKLVRTPRRVMAIMDDPRGGGAFLKGAELLVDYVREETLTDGGSIVVYGIDLGKHGMSECPVQWFTVAEYADEN